MMVINTAADSNFFLKLICLIMSIIENDKDNRQIRVWDIGLENDQLDVLKSIKQIEIRKVPKFMNHWNSGYAWKIYIFKHVPDDIIYYMDTGMSVLNSLEKIEDMIQKDGWFAVGQGAKITDSTPENYWDELSIDKNLYKNNEQFSAGLIGFKRDELFTKIINKAYDLTLQGYTLGYSKNELWKDRYNIGIIRECKIFRQDQTILNLIVRQYMNNCHFEQNNKYICNNKCNNENLISWHRTVKSRDLLSFMLLNPSIRNIITVGKYIILKIINKTK